MSSSGDNGNLPPPTNIVESVEGVGAKVVVEPQPSIVPPKHVSTEASSYSQATATLLPRPGMTSPALRGCKNQSEVWNFFILEPGSDKNNKSVICNFYANLIMCALGTSAMHTHLKRCKNNLDREENKRPKNMQSFVSAEGDGGAISGLSPLTSYFKFDQEVFRTELVRMFIAAELPFRFVENKAFRKLLSVLQLRFIIPSCATLTIDILLLFDAEEVKLKRFISKHCRRVCLTTDTWNSCQNMNYMCLTAHFIDNDWRLHKKILNFYQITGHTREVMAQSVEICLNNWELNRVISLTVDNASSNDVGIQYLIKRLMSWNSVILKGEYIHMHCCAHIINLIVREGLKEINDSILRIRGAVKYIKSSPSRLSRFRTYAQQEKISFKSLVCLDIETLWNLTYTMLEATLKYQQAFELQRKREGSA